VRPPSPTLRAALSAVVVLAPLVGCGARERRIGGRVTEFGTGRPVPGAAVTVAWRGWGRAPDGQLVWDKDYTIDARAGADGRFSVAYRGPGSAKVTVVAAGFQPLSRWVAAGDDAVTSSGATRATARFPAARSRWARRRTAARLAVRPLRSAVGTSPPRPRPATRRGPTSWSRRSCSRRARA
jgi:hypothetical protein